MCDNFVANMYGYSSSGYSTAMVHWNSIPQGDKHPGDWNAPAGALMFWGGGMGHVAISDGNGGIVSTDMPGAGQVSTVSRDTPTTKWGKPYLGWTVPYFQGQAGTVAPVGYSNLAGGGPQPFSIGSLLNPLGPLGLGNTSGSNWKDMLERFGLITFGAVMVMIGLWKMTGTGNPIKSIGSAKKDAGKVVGKEADDAVDGEG
jgi:hypothetical protein